jgi:hypothetical protein
MILQKMKIPTLKEHRDNPKMNGVSWFDAWGQMCCEECQKVFTPGEIILYAGNRKGYHRHCAPKKELE